MLSKSKPLFPAWSLMKSGDSDLLPYPPVCIATDEHLIFILRNYGHESFIMLQDICDQFVLGK